MCNNLVYDPKSGDTEVRMCNITGCVVQSHLMYLMSSEKC
jgi:hypothetical protein